MTSVPPDRPILTYDAQTSKTPRPTLTEDEKKSSASKHTTHLPSPSEFLISDVLREANLSITTPVLDKRTQRVLARNPATGKAVLVQIGSIQSDSSGDQHAEIVKHNGELSQGLIATRPVGKDDWSLVVDMKAAGSGNDHSKDKKSKRSSSSSSTLEHKAQKRSRPTIKPEPTPVPGLRLAGLSIGEKISSDPEEVIDLTLGHSQVVHRFFMNLYPISSEEDMAKRPIFQHPKNPQLSHPTIEQPVCVDVTKDITLASDPVDHVTINKMKYTLSRLLKAGAKAREAHELKYFSIAKITSDNMPEKLSNHVTVLENMRGVVAKTKIPKGTPLQFSGQYLKKDEMKKLIKEIVNGLVKRFNFSEDIAKMHTINVIDNYKWIGVKLGKYKLELNGWGAGNIASFINHDDKDPNMSMAILPTLDRKGKSTAKLVTYYTLRDIEPGEQLLINYGKEYFKAHPDVFKPITGQMDIAMPLSSSTRTSLTQALVKQENRSINFVPEQQHKTSSSKDTKNSKNLGINKKKNGRDFVSPRPKVSQVNVTDSLIAWARDRRRRPSEPTDKEIALDNKNLQTAKLFYQNQVDEINYLMRQIDKTKKKTKASSSEFRLFSKLDHDQRRRVLKTLANPRVRKLSNKAAANLIRNQYNLPFFDEGNVKIERHANKDLRRLKNQNKTETSGSVKPSSSTHTAYLNAGITVFQNARLPAGHHWLDVPRDGNCFYHALATALGRPNDHAAFRQRTANYAATHPEYATPAMAQAIATPGEYTGSADSGPDLGARAHRVGIAVILENGTVRELNYESNRGEQPNITMARASDHFFLAYPSMPHDIQGDNERQSG